MHTYVHAHRYYVAEGVRLYSQESWRIVTDNKGVELVGQYIKNVVDFYISQSQAANHAVREAACSCIAELGTKVSIPYVTRNFTMAATFEVWLDFEGGSTEILAQIYSYSSKLLFACTYNARVHTQICTHLHAVVSFYLHARTMHMCIRAQLVSGKIFKVLH